MKQKRDRQLKTSRVFIPGNSRKSDRFYPLLRMSGKWLAELGFSEGASAYVTIVGPDTITISSSPPMLVRESLTPIDVIKQEYAKLSIPTERKYKVTMLS
jgi:hypothetical protein